MMHQMRPLSEDRIMYILTEHQRIDSRLNLDIYRTEFMDCHAKTPM